MTNNYMLLDSKDYDTRMAIEESSRCLLCMDAPCSTACPAETDPAKFIRSIRFRNFSGAAETIRESNIFGGVCAQVCPAGKLCEGACIRAEIDRPIEIRKLQKFAVEYERLSNMQILTAPKEKKLQKIVCVGAGPASLACAAKLAQNGYQVDVYESQAKAGGMLSYGIPPFRLSQELIDFDVQTVTNLGVKIFYNTKVGKDISFDTLQQQYDAVFVGAGLWSGLGLAATGAQLKGVVNAIDYLATARGSDGKQAIIANNVIIIGAGDTAMDCAATAKKLGAENVSILYRSRIEKAPAYHEELEAVQKSGVAIFPQFQISQIKGDSKVEMIIAKHQDGVSELTLKADLIITAIGQKLDPELQLNINPSSEKSLKVDEKFATNLLGVYAAGDITNGGKTVVQAVQDGKLAANAIIDFLGKGA